MNQKIGLNPIGFLFSKMWKYSEGNRKKVTLFWCMFALASMVPLVFEPLIMARIMNSIQENGLQEENLPLILKYLCLYFLCTLVFWSLHGPARVMEMNNAFLLRLNYRKYFLGGIMHLPMPWHVDHHSGDTIDRVEKGTGALFTFSEETFELLYTFANLVICYGVLMYFSVTAGLIALTFLIASAVITITIDLHLVKNYTQLSRAENAATQGVFDALSNITTVIILRVEKYVFESVIRLVEDQRKLTFSTNRISEFKWFLTSVCCALMTVAVLAHYFWSQSKIAAPVLIGTVYLLISYLRRMDEVFFRFTSFYSNLVKWRVRAHNAEELSHDFKVRNFDNDTLPPQWRSIEVKDLSFSYASSDVAQLRGVNLQLRRGSKVALIGESGSGKTTLLKVMRALFEPDSGDVLVDGVVCKEGFESFGESIALIPQDPEIFEATIRYNLTLGAEYSPGQIEQAMKITCFDAVLPNLPHGLDSSIKEKGVNLSGGQRQRLALARGILASLGDEKGVVLLDEPTSSLDMVTEKEVYTKLLAAFEGKLVVSTLHKLHLLHLFDHIVMFENGVVIASGSFEQLFDTCPAFRKMWDVHRGQQ